MYNFPSKVLRVFFNGDFAVKMLPAPGFKPMTFRLVTSGNGHCAILMALGCISLSDAQVPIAGSH